VNVIRDREVAHKPLVANHKVAVKLLSENAECRDACWYKLEIENDDCTDDSHRITILRCKKEIYCLLLDKTTY